MRELKFRAWDKEDKFFIDDGALQFGADGKIYYIYAGLEYGEPELEREDITDEVIVEQYTGLKDKHGKEIYEGDIVRDLGGNHEVKFCEMKDTDCSYFYQGWGFDDSSLYEEHDFVEVIGNIHENPELLEREDAKG